MGGPQPKKSKVLESKDLGATWTDITGFPANFTEGTSTAGFPDVETHSLVVMPDYPDNIWVGTNIGIVETTDRGASWNIIPYATSNFPHVTVWDMKIKDQGEIVLATHGRGIWTATVPYLVNWEPKENIVTLSVDTVNIIEGQDAKLTITAEKDVSPNGPITVKDLQIINSSMGTNCCTLSPHITSTTRISATDLGVNLIESSFGLLRTMPIRFS